MATIIRRRANKKQTPLRIGSPFDGIQNLEVRRLAKNAHQMLFNGFADIINEMVSKPHGASVWFEAEVTPERINLEFSLNETEIKLISKKRMLDRQHSPFGMSGGMISVLPDDVRGVCHELARRYPSSKNLLTRGGFTECGPPRRPKQKVRPEVFRAILADTLIKFVEAHSTQHALKALKPIEKFKREMSDAILKQKRIDARQELMKALTA